MDDQRNLMIAIACAVVILIAYNFFVTGPAMRRQEALEQAQAAAAAEQQAEIPEDTVVRSAEVVRAESQRIPIDNAHVRGSLALSGARIDDIYLKDHYTTVEAKDAQDPTQEVELLRPRGSEGAFYATIGWTTVEGGPEGLPGFETPWRLVEGADLTPETPVTLEYSAGGLNFRRVVSVDDLYMFTFTDTVTNTTAGAVPLASYGQVRRHGLPAAYRPNGIVHEGGVAVAGGQLQLRKYGKLANGEERNRTGEEPGGWAGITEHYWLAAVIPDQAATVTIRERALRPGEDMRAATYEATYQTQTITLAPGETVASTARIFAGAKEYDVIMDYQNDLGVDRFIDAIDWGNFWFLTRPYFWTLEHIDSVVGNFGVAILIMVVIIKLLFFPIANRAYASMAQMKKVQPKMKELQDKYKEDRERLQKEMAALYREEKLNPVGGCLPILFQIPVFFALYKTISVTIEMRHEPFFGWVKDLSAPDPLMVGNLFGLLPWDPASVTAIPMLGGILFTIIGIGVWPIIMGVTMWLLQSLNPPPPDPTQARIIGLMPIFFTFILGSFAVGLVIYWAWNNVLSLFQQYFIMRRHGVQTEFDKLIARLRGKPPETEA